MAMSRQDAEDALNLAKQNLNTAEQLTEVYNRLSGILDDQNRSISSYKNAQIIINQKKKEENFLTEQLQKGNDRINEFLRAGIDINDDRIKLLKEELKVYEQRKATLKQETQILQQNSSLISASFNELKDGIKYWVQQEFTIRSIYSYLMDIDKGIKSYQLNLGLSGNKAEFLRKQMEEAANTAQRYGGTINDIVELQGKVNELTGRANVFTENQIANMVVITKGTGMANEEAANLVGNILALGSSLEDSKRLIEGTVNETAKLGLNSSTVLKGMSTNIAKLNNYRFQNGIDGLKKMVQSSEKFKFSMEGAFNAAEKFRTLEGLLEAGANLRVLGGEFAKMDEFKLSFLARNKPEEFAIEMAKLTKGMASFNKETGLFDISDIDFDKLRSVAELTGRDINDVAKSTRELNKIEFAKKQIFVGTDEEKEMLAKLATFQKGSTIGMIQIGDKNVRLDQLTDKQLELYKQTQKTLEQRAIDSQTFDESMKNTIMQFKSTFIPILEYINDALSGFNKFMDIFREENGKMKKWAVAVPITLMALASGLYKLFGSLPSILGKIPGIGKFFGGGAGNTPSTAPTNAPLSGSQALGAGKGAMYKSFGSAATLAAIGVAAVGIGYGFKMAAEGAASLSESISKLTGDQLITLQNTLKTLGSTMLMGLAAAILAVGIAGSAGAVGFLAFGAAALGVGAGIGLAALGIGEMAKGFEKLKDVDMVNIGKGMMGIAGAALMLGNPLSIAGLASIGLALAGITALDFTNVVPLQNLKFVDKDIKNMKEMAELVGQIASIDTSKLNQLQKLFTNSTLKVQLEGNPMINNHITVEVDGEKFYKKVEKMIPIVVRRGAMPK